MRKVSGWLAAAAIAVTVGGTVLAQQVRERDPAARPGTAAGAPREGATPRAGQHSQADQQIAAIKLQCCRNELELAKLAQEKATSPEVKQFAEKMVKEHTEGCQKLEQIAGHLAADHGPGDAARPERATVRPGADRPGADRPAPRAEGRPGADAVPDAAPRAGAAADEGRDVNVRVQPGRAGADLTVRGSAPGSKAGGDLDWVSIHNQISDECLAESKKELASKSGAEFDKCYIGMAIGSHKMAVVSDKVFMNHASQQFKGDLQQCMETCKEHLQVAKDIMQKLDGGAARTARKPE